MRNEHSEPETGRSGDVPPGQAIPPPLGDPSLSRPEEKELRRGTVRRALAALETEIQAVGVVLTRIATRVQRLLERRGLDCGEGDLFRADPVVEASPALAGISS